MESYRIYHVGAGGRLRLGDTVRCRTDEEAVAAARSLLAPGQSAELWHGGRIVGRFSHTHEFRPGAG